MQSQPIASFGRGAERLWDFSQTARAGDGGVGGVPGPGVDSTFLFQSPARSSPAIPSPFLFLIWSSRSPPPVPSFGFHCAVLSCLVLPLFNPCQNKGWSGKRGSGVETGSAFRRQTRTEPTHALGLSLVLLLLFSFLQFGTLLTSECWDYRVPSQTWLEVYYKSGMKTDHVTCFTSFHLSRQRKTQRGSEIRAGIPSWQVIAV